jgi:hypothetical protein
MVADSARTIPDEPPNDVTKTDADGRFTVRATRDSGIIAEIDDRRSRPRVIGDGAVELTLEPTRSFTGKLANDAVPAGVIVTAHYQLAPARALPWRIGVPARALSWEVGVVVDRDHGFRLAGVPAPTESVPRMWLDSVLDPNQPERKVDVGPLRDGATPRWPMGPTIDVIVHGATDNRTNIWMLRGHQTATRRSELAALYERLDHVVQHPAFVVGIGDRTPMGTPKYVRNDRHGVFLGNPPGNATVCITPPDSDSATCQRIVVRDQPLVVEFPPPKP